jgi:DNA repair ATPase RecN
MKICRENINKLKALCEELENRDEQLKINAEALWDILSNIQEAKNTLEKIVVESTDGQAKINTVVEKLNSISDIVSNKGCKRVSQNAG